MLLDSEQQDFRKESYTSQDAAYPLTDDDGSPNSDMLNKRGTEIEGRIISDKNCNVHEYSNLPQTP